MINGDRLLRIIYREANINELFFLGKGVDNVDDAFYKNVLSYINRQFNLNDANYMDKLCDKYLSIYPDNYNKTDVLFMIRHYNNLASEEYPLLAGNALAIIFYFAEKLLKRQDGQIQIEFNDFLEWDGFVNKIDANIFIASYCALNNCKNELENSPSILRCNNERLYRILGKGAAENHMHLNASGYGTEINLNNFMTAKLFNQKTYQCFGQIASIGSSSIGFHEQENKLHLIKMKILKLILKYWEEDEKESQLTKDDIFKILNAKSLIEMTIWYEKLTKWQNRLESEYEDFYKSEKGNQQYLIEQNFLIEEINKVLSNSSDILRLYLLNVYIAMLSKFKFEYLQDNVGSGFEKFKQKENNKSMFKGNKPDNVIESVFDKYYGEEFVKKIEIRVSPTDITLKKYREIDKINSNIYSKIKDKTNISKIQFALISHFIKPSEVSVKHRNQFTRWDDLKDKYDKEQKRLMSELNNLNKSEKKVVAIDTANYEAFCRPEVFGEFYRKIRNEFPDLKITYHVGESFPTIANGLRAIFEAIEFLGYQRGDRLGHAIALGINVKDSFERKRHEVFTTLQEYLDDIAWLYFIISTNFSQEVECCQYLFKEYEKKIVKVFNGIDVGSFSIENYINSMMLRSDNGIAIIQDLILNSNNRYKYNNTKLHNEAALDLKAKELVVQYLYCEKLYSNGNEICNEKELDDLYIKSVELAQSALKKIVVDKGIAIEVNPSSNKKIALIRRYDELPLLRFNNYGLTAMEDCEKFKPNKYNIPVSINTDDSAIFQSNLSNEYVLLLASLSRKYETESVYDYIEYLRRSSLEQNFIK